MKLLFSLVVSIFMVSLSACSVSMVENQPLQKDLSVLHIGVRRDVVVKELGSPVHTVTNDKGTYDAYIICQGKYSNEEKAVRVAYYTMADLITLGLWEIVGTPVEKAATGEMVKAWVIYGSDNKIVKIENLDLRGSLPSGLCQEFETTESPRKLWIPPQTLYCE